MNNSINYICAWNHKNRENTWSGIPYALQRALKNIVQLECFNIGLSKIEFFIARVLDKFLWKKGYCVAEQKISSFKFKKIHNDNVNIVVNGGITVKNKTKTYFYIDLSVSALQWFKKNDNEAFEKSTFETLSQRFLQKWCDTQNRTFSNIAGIFTMSSWLKEFLQNKTNVPCNIFYTGGGITLTC